MNRKKLKLNVKFNKDNIPECAKSPSLCKGCKDINQCEKLDFYYYPYSKKDVRECFNNSEKKT